MRLVTLVLLLSATLAHADGPLCRARVPDLFRRPVARPAPARAAAAKPAAVGEARQFWAWDFSVMPPGFRRVTATCRAAGARGLVYVEDSEWGTRFTEADLATIVERFERTTPGGSLAPDVGIGQIVECTFAPPPLGLDGDPRVVLLFTAMASFNGTSFDGYFNGYDTLTEAQAQAEGQHSNECEVLYLNTRGSPVSSDYMLGVVAHELTHLVSHPFDAAEQSWLDESLGEAAMVACGYPTDIKHLERFAKKPETPLVTDSYVSYGACFLFGTYLLEQLGPQALGRIVRDPLPGVAGLEATLSAHGRGPFAAFHRDWAQANLVAHGSPSDPRLRYRAFPVPQLTIRGVDALPAHDAGELAPYRVRYLRLPAIVTAANVSLLLEPSNVTARLHAIRQDGAAVGVADLLGAAGVAEVAPGGPAPVLVLLGDDKAGYRLEITPAR